jgi:serine/threonine-protein kinase
MDRRLAQPQDSASSTVQVPKPGEVIEGKYRIEKVLGGGGMGVVLAAHHELLDQRVAVKVLTSSDQKAMSRFSLEAKATAQLKSEHVARVMDVGTLPNGAPFMVMEYLEGCDLEELLRLHRRLPVEETVGYMLDAADGLAQAHALEIIHRDLKPANLFLAVQTSGTSIVKLVDFGISKSIASRRTGKTGVLTGDHSTVGSPTYMAPEQIRSPKDVDARSDIWALGVVMYELLTGAPPFQGDSVGEIFAAVLEHKPPPLATVVPEVPQGLSDVISRCLSAERSKRYASVLELAGDLAPFGPPDSAARVKRIEQTLRAMKAKAEGKGAGRVRVSTPTPGIAFETPTADASDAETKEIIPPAAPSTPRRRGAAQTAQHAFASDSPSLDERASATSPSLRRQGSRRKAVVIGGVVGVGLLVGVLALLHGGAPDAGLATATPKGPPSAMPLPPLSNAPSQPSAGREPALVAVDSLPTAKPKQGAAAPVQPARKSASPATPKKHLSVLDSPD